MNEPRPSTGSARPLLSASMVAKRSYTRIGSSELSTTTAEPSFTLLVAVASPANTVSGALTAKSGR